MVCKLCPARKHCFDKGICENCAFGQAFEKTHKKVERLKAKNEALQAKNEALQAKNEALQAKTEWISVDERLPELNVLVLAILDEPCLRLNFPFEEQVLILLRERLPYSVGIVEEWRRPFSSETINYDGRVTHWMSLPEPPKGE